MSRAWVCGRSRDEPAGSNRAGAWIPDYDCCVLLGRHPCVGLITTPESYRLCCLLRDEEAMARVESQFVVLYIATTFRRNLLHPSSGQKKENGQRSYLIGKLGMEFGDSISESLYCVG
jgi:hypothetical protein